MGLAENLCNQEKVITTEAVGGLPGFTVFVKSGYGYVVAYTAFGVVFPDGGFDVADAQVFLGS